MLERLGVRGFRGFEDLEISGLSRINLFAGRNNIGKSTLLEAIFLLAGAGDPNMALNGHIVRMQGGTKAPTSVWETLWMPLFRELDADAGITIVGRHASVGDMRLRIVLERPVTTAVSRTGDGGVLTGERVGDRSLKFTYTDSRVGRIQSEARDTGDKTTFDRKEDYFAFGMAMIQPGRGDVERDAIDLGRLRKKKRGDLLLDALRVLEPQLRGIEDNASSGVPMIWVDIGLRELVPLSVLGAGVTHLTRIVLAAAAAPGGVVLVDEIENGLHHSVLPDVWRVVREAAEQFNVQVFATTHSFECVEAAHEELGADGFRLHRLEVVDGAVRCVTLSPTAISGAIRHNMEIR